MFTTPPSARPPEQRTVAPRAAIRAGTHDPRRPLIILVALLGLLWAATLAFVAMNRGATSEPPPADLFMQSVVTRDAELGWRQLCPELQAQVPPALLHDQAEAQRRAEVAQGVTLGAEYAGSSPESGGGEVRRYTVTARYADGRVEQTTFSVTTRASGCVADVT